MSNKPWPTPPRGYKDTLVNRCNLLARVALLQKLGSHRSPTSSNIIYLSATRLVKFGRTVHLAEASALRLVAACTSVPVPKVYCAFHDEKSGKSYIVMERIDGERLGEKWGEMSESEREGILGQLKEMWDELRGIVNLRPGAVCAADGGALHDHRIWGGAGAKGMGPFKTESDFNLFLRNGIESTENMAEGKLKRDVERLIEMHREQEGRTVFTHGDISGSNILIKGDKVVGLIDFEMAGFYPEYWEYTTAINSHYVNDGITNFLSPYPTVLDMVNLWRMIFCDGP